MRRALANANADLVRRDQDYVARVTGDDGDLGKTLLSAFQDVEERTPVILTTSQLLTTGVDAPMVKNVVLFRHIGSMTDFKQIIGRGTRVREDYGKLFFTILDYTGTATRNFADPAFDGELVRATVERMEEDGSVAQEPELESTTEGLTEEGEVGADGDDTAGEQAEITYVVEPPRLLHVRERQEPRKFYLSDGVEVTIVHETVQQLDASGHKLRTVQLTDYTGEQVRTLCRSADDLRGQWVEGQQRQGIIAALGERGIELEHLAAVIGQAEAGPFDLLCHLAFSAPVHTRRERADRLRREQRAFFARYAPDARAILDLLLDQYAAHGPAELKMPEVLHLPIVERRGTVREIAALFGGLEQLRDAVTELQALLYAA